MKLQNVLTFRLSVLKAIGIALWAVGFYFAIIKEINNKTDDSLTSYAEALITDYLAGVPCPTPTTAQATTTIYTPCRTSMPRATRT